MAVVVAVADKRRHLRGNRGHQVVVCCHPARRARDPCRRPPRVQARLVPHRRQAPNLAQAPVADLRRTVHKGRAVRPHRHRRAGRRQQVPGTRPAAPTAARTERGRARPTAPRTGRPMDHPPPPPAALPAPLPPALRTEPRAGHRPAPPTEPRAGHQPAPPAEPRAAARQAARRPAARAVHRTPVPARPAGVAPAAVR